MTPRRGLAILPLSLVSSAASAADAVQQTSGFTSFFQALMGLAVVLGLLYGFFWLLRRFGPGQTGAQGAVRIVGGVMLGPRERLVVVEVQDTWLLVGVAAGHVSTLHTLPRPEGLAPAPLQSAPQPFSDKLADLLKRSKG
ncbi:MAG: flagellar biosynthetic protein FliO [Hydrogenophilales bacterium CG03_land_8_20_14_0_80_62_28]|nr:MAG: flagellar biosynthetic protein FliO [Hydrogenophilaceae bacterium CG1_02_62_390]PIV23282.1 MAG: flagellar biosynthetic protein FliO [Hydrogenophilales bacterium CG03_land_8_20_14_0_80_62_28]PIW39018.1 MAG: flagellar biosynthetic protein FliO [Hydrogenophilales bacterium CG15_BIG_FIL_POST_REV_8_21_14_020_62_31]PIW70779.1 MAG: flagellar biosynthetic protein FliO [Hydrogenophilales bacterium CG12_big_fil_rev_8_21_14_0_65_61_21]PIY99556.1 MAG: flagellar biosynthetic protein FliO [Hydrogenop